MIKDLLEGLNPAQKEAVLHEQGPLLIVAGAGTGKTTVLTRRYAYLRQERGYSTDQILALTFTEKAAGEMEDRVIRELPTGTYDFWISTFHGFCQRVLEAHGLEIGIPNQFRLLTPTDTWLLLKRHISELPLDHYRPLGNPVKFLRALISHISKAKDEGITPEHYAQFVQNFVLDGDHTDLLEGEKKRLQELSDMYFAYRKILLDEGALDFGDLILETLRLFQERPAILRQYQDQFRAVMVDEFQDTNLAQYELLKLLTARHRGLTVVGDDDQAIYKFRGASLANILQFRDDFPDTKTIALTENYRSREEILTTAYEFIQKNNPHRLEVKLQETGLSKRLQAIRGDGGSVRTLWRTSVEEEADTVAEHIRTLKQESPQITWSDIAILVRSNDGAEPFVRALERYGVPYQFMAMRGLYAMPVILDVIALLSLLDNYREASAIWRVLNLSCYALSRLDIADIMQYVRSKQAHSFWQTLRVGPSSPLAAILSDHGKRQLAKIIADIEGLSEMTRRDSPMRVFKKMLEVTGYLAHLLQQPETTKAEAIQHLHGFSERIQRYEQSTHRPSLREFMEELRMEIESGEEGALDLDPNAGPDLVRVMTVHASKGLEFKQVYMVSMVDQRFPTRLRTDAIPLPDGLIQERLPEGDAHLEEERRLLYVAMTRAKDGIMLSGASKYGGTREKKPSIFFQEAGLSIPEHARKLEQQIKRLQTPEELEMLEPDVRTLYQLKRRFSFTQLSSFRRCPLQYKFAHIYRIPTDTTGSQVFGQVMHIVFQRIMELHVMRTQSVQASLFAAPTESIAMSAKGLRVSWEEAQKIFQDAWRDDWYPGERDHEAYLRTGQRALRKFYDAYLDEVPDIVEVEREYTLILGQHSLRAKIDRIDRLPDGRVRIVDYKTSDAKEKVEGEDREQLYLYQIALEARGMQVGSLMYVYIKEWVLVEIEPLTGDKREAFIEKITERMDAILASRFDPDPDVMTCGHCDFRHICEFRKMR